MKRALVLAVTLVMVLFSTAAFAGFPVVGLQLGVDYDSEVFYVVTPTIGAEFVLETKSFSSVLSVDVSKKSWFRNALQIEGLYTVDTQIAFPLIGRFSGMFGVASIVNVILIDGSGPSAYGAGLALFGEFGVVYGIPTFPGSAYAKAMFDLDGYLYNLTVGLEVDLWQLFAPQVNESI